MSPRPRAPVGGADEPEPRHSDLLRALELGLHGLEIRAVERHSAVLQRLDAGDGRFARIEQSILQLATDQAEARGKAEAAADELEDLREQLEAKIAALPEPAPAPAETPDKARERIRDWVTIGTQIVVGIGAFGGFVVVVSWACGVAAQSFAWAASILQHFGPPSGPHQ